MSSSHCNVGDENVQEPITGTASAATGREKHSMMKKLAEEKVLVWGMKEEARQNNHASTVNLQLEGAVRNGVLCFHDSLIL